MRKLLFILGIWLLTLQCWGQTGETRPVGAKALQTPNNATFHFLQSDTTVGIGMGSYGYMKLAPYRLLMKKENTLIKGDLTESIGGLQFSATRQVIGGGADLQLSSGYFIPTTTEQTTWNTMDNSFTNEAQSLTSSNSVDPFLNLSAVSGVGGGNVQLIGETGIDITRDAMSNVIRFNATGNTGGDVFKLGNPASTQLAVWTDDHTIYGTSNFTYNGYDFVMKQGGIYTPQMKYIDTDYPAVSYNTYFENSIARHTIYSGSTYTPLMLKTTGVTTPGLTLQSSGVGTYEDVNGSVRYNGTDILGKVGGSWVSLTAAGGGSMTYPGAGIALSTGSAWGTSIANNSGNWNTAYTNMGKVYVGAASGTPYTLSTDYFIESVGYIFPKMNQNPTSGSTLPVSSGGMFTTLQSYVPYTGATGNVNLGTTYTITAQNFIGSSDRTLKRNINPIDFSNVDEIDLKQFIFRSDSTNRIRYGVIAQEVEKKIPELVYTDNDGIKSVGYNDFIILKLAAMDARIKKLESELLSREYRKNKFTKSFKQADKEFNRLYNEK